MISFNARLFDPTFDQWDLTDKIISDNLTPEMKEIKSLHGYEGLFHLVPQYFGMTRMYRDPGGCITYEFTEEQWVWFLLRWL